MWRLAGRCGAWLESGYRTAFFDRLVEAQLLLLRVETRDERRGHTARVSVASRNGGGQATLRCDTSKNACAMAYIMISWFIAVRMLRLGRRFLLRSAKKWRFGVRVRIEWKAKRTGVVQAGDRHHN